MRRGVVFLAGAAALLAAAALAEEPQNLSARKLRTIGEGRGLYLTYCTDCHGWNADGVVPGSDQPAAPNLKVIGVRDTKFDRLHVAEHIRGRSRDRTSEMPCWSKVNVRGGHWGTRTVDGNVFALVRYVEFAQQR